MQLTGSEIVIECLKEQGVDTVFGYPGGAILNVYDALYKHRSEIRHILTSHEQGASHAADGYARATGKVGVCLATSGPGATNLVTGIATAYMDSVPLVAITCNVGVSLLGKDSFQEIDITGITMPITKHNYIVKDVNDLVCWNEYLLKEYGKDHQIILYGKEAGANTILKAASKHLLKNVKAIISDGAYTSVYDILAYRFVKYYKVIIFPTIHMIRHKIKQEIKINIKESYPLMLKHNDIPTLFIHMKNDDFVPLDMVYPLYNANRGNKELFVLKDERYLYELKETDDFKNTLKNFIFEYVND